ncbi:MAG TPA: insulinase family protein [Xanthomonadaceae bacterium]|jgi:predicted Zn-dependent peptidase
MPSSPRNKRTATVLAGCLIAATVGAATPDRWNLPVATRKLDNGLTVVVSEDHSSPTIGISVVYRVGIRTEPRDRTGFAHLFEHLMFEGTPGAPHGVFDRVTSDGGGDNNGSTHPDFTTYTARAPVSALEPLLWLEADRMKTLAFSKASLDGQRDVVKEEIQDNVNNRPYGGFAETDLPLLAFQKWENGHDGYGSFDDLDKAGLDDVRAFHREFYGPNNAVLGIAGDVTPEQGFALAQKYFGAISARATPPRPDVDEPLNTAEKRIVQGDGLAKLPALAIGWKMPPRGSRDQAAMVVLGELLAGGDASRLHQALVKGSALAVQVGDFTGSGSPWEYDGPTLYTLVAIYKTDGKADVLLAAIDAQIERIEKEGVDPATLEGVKTRMLADWYDDLEPFVDRAETLAVLQATWGNAAVANQVPDLIDGVTSVDIQRVAATYLTHANRSIIDRRPDFMLPPGDPARSDARAKPAPKRPVPTGKVSVGNIQIAPTPAAPAPAIPAAPAPAPTAKPASARPGQQAPTPPPATPTVKPEASKPAEPPPAPASGTTTTVPPAPGGTQPATATLPAKPTAAVPTKPAAIGVAPTTGAAPATAGTQATKPPQPLPTAQPSPRIDAPASTPKPAPHEPTPSPVVPQAKPSSAPAVPASPKPDAAKAAAKPAEPAPIAAKPATTGTTPAVPKTDGAGQRNNAETKPSLPAKSAPVQPSPATVPPPQPVKSGSGPPDAASPASKASDASGKQ